jgi:hypothetical protein
MDVSGLPHGTPESARAYNLPAYAEDGPASRNIDFHGGFFHST